MNIHGTVTADANGALDDEPEAGFDAGVVAAYVETLSLIERLHRLLLDVIKDEFERLGRLDINSVQALLLYNIGENEVTAGELKSRGYYQGSNVSYNLKKLVDMGYIAVISQRDHHAGPGASPEGHANALTRLYFCFLRPEIIEQPVQRCGHGHFNNRMTHAGCLPFPGHRVCPQFLWITLWITWVNRFVYRTVTPLL